MIKEIMTVAFLVAGLLFIGISVAGIFRFNDFFSRLQVMGVGQGLGTVLCCIGLFIYEGFTNTGIKILIVMIFTLVGGPIGTHIIDKVAYKEALMKRMAENTHEGRVGGEEKPCL